MPDKELCAKCGRGRDDSDHDYDHSFVPSPSTVDEAHRALTAEETAYARAAIEAGTTLVSTDSLDVARDALVTAVRREEQQKYADAKQEMADQWWNAGNRWGALVPTARLREAEAALASERARAEDAEVRAAHASALSGKFALQAARERAHRERLEEAFAPKFTVHTDTSAGQCASCGACIGWEESHTDGCFDSAVAMIEAARAALAAAPGDTPT